MKKWYQSKTIQLAALQALTGLLVAFGTEYPEVGLIAVAKSLLDVLIRLNTTKAVK